MSQQSSITAAIGNLAQLRKGQSATVIGLAEDSDDMLMRTRLQELGFLPGERLHVHAESFLGKDPMAIRIGNSIFALRRLEAERIYVVQSDESNC